MGKLDDVLADRGRARAELFRARQAHADAIAATQAAERARQESMRTEATALEGVRRAERHFVEAVAKLHPLLDADVSGIVGRKASDAIADDGAQQAAAGQS